jgi:nickel-dependent lactate racemase
MVVRLRYGQGWMEARLPEDWRIDVLIPAGSTPIGDIGSCVAEALDRPLNAAPVHEKARGARNAVIVVSDITRPVPNAVVLPALLDRLEAAGVAPHNVVVLVATGLHRAATQDEVREIVGEKVLEAGVEVVSHRAREDGEHKILGTTQSGTPVAVDRRYLEAAVRIVVGLVEPHFMAGFSGGPKSICPGLTAAETIMCLHCPLLLSDPRSAPGVVQGNPVMTEIRQAAHLAGSPDVCVNFVLDIERRMVGVYAGEMAAVHAAAIARARKVLTARIDKPADLAITSAGGYPLDLTFYQGVKGIVAGAEIVRPGGGVVVVQRNAEGIGSSEFAALLAGCGDPATWAIDYGARRAQVVDEWEVVELAKAAKKARIVNVCPDANDELRSALPIPTAYSVEEAVEILLERGVALSDPPHVAVLPDGPYTLVKIGE